VSGERHTLAAVLATCVGITEADVRKWTQHPCYDIYLVQAWNHKRYQVTSLEAYKEQCRRKRSLFRPNLSHLSDQT
jgi:hypothetical protein